MIFWIFITLLVAVGMFAYFQREKLQSKFKAELGLNGDLTTTKNAPRNEYDGPFEFQPKPDTYDLVQAIKAKYPGAIITRTSTPISVKLKLIHSDGSVTVADGKNTHDANRVLALKLGVTE